MAYIDCIIQICFQNFMSLKRIGFQRQKSFLKKTHINLAVFPHIGFKASLIMGKKVAKKRFCCSEVILGYTIL